MECYLSSSQDNRQTHHFKQYLEYIYLWPVRGKIIRYSFSSWLAVRDWRHQNLSQILLSTSCYFFLVQFIPVRHHPHPHHSPKSGWSNPSRSLLWQAYITHPFWLSYIDRYILFPLASSPFLVKSPWERGGGKTGWEFNRYIILVIIYSNPPKR